MGRNETQELLLKAQAAYEHLHQKAVTNCHAVIVSKFTQAIEPVASFLRMNEESRDGICEALVNRWIIAHAHEGSLWNDLYITTQSGQQLLKIPYLNELVAEHAALGLHSSGPASGIQQRMNSLLLLQRHGIVPRMTLGHLRQGGGQRMHADNGATTGLSGASLGKAILASLDRFRSYGRGAGSYVTVHIGGDRGAHVICLYLGGSGTPEGMRGRFSFSDVSFFDPNVGEFWFGSGRASSNDFIRFFLHVFDRLYRGLDEFEVRGFGRAVS